MLEHDGVRLDLIRLFQVEATTSVLKIDQARVGESGEAEDLERTGGHARMRAVGVGHHLHGDLEVAGHRREVAQLVAGG